MIEGGADNDMLDGGEDGDALYGQAGDDILYAGGGDDRLYGYEGNDALYGQSGNNYLYGEEGDDLLYAGTGNDTLIGGSGYDQAFGSIGNDTIRESELSIGRGGNDIVSLTSHSSDVGIGGAGDDWLEGYGNDQLRGGSGNDVLISLGANDTLQGGSGSDILLADGSANGSSRLFGGEGDDFLSGNGGNQLLVGGSGTDTFYFGHSLLQTTETNSATSPSIGDDRIVDFEIGVDTISIDQDLAQSFDDLVIEQHGITTRITLSDGATITLNNTQATDISASDFTFTTSTTYSNTLNDWQSYLTNSWGYATIDEPNITWRFSQGSKMIGNHQDNQLLGSASSSEYLDGGAGDDTLASNGGNDILVGGAGNDAFNISEQPRIAGDRRSKDVQVTQVEDFTVGEDTLAINFYSFNVRGVDLSTITAEQVVSSAVYTLGDHFRVVLKNTDVTAISNDDIAFGVIGNDGNEVIKGSTANNEILGKEGHDTLYGYSGNDELNGGAGSDTLYGGDGDDLLWGEGGHDTLFGDAGNDTLYSGGGNNELDGGMGDDLLVAQQGNHVLTGGKVPIRLRSVITILRTKIQTIRLPSAILRRTTTASL